MVDLWLLTEPLVRLSTLLDNLYDTGTESLDSGNVVGEDTHVTGSGGEVDLGHGGRGVDGLVLAVVTSRLIGSQLRLQPSTPFPASS